MKIDIEQLQSIIQELYIPMIEREHGTAAIPILKNLISCIRTIYQHYSPEHNNAPIAILQRVDGVNSHVIDAAPIVVRDVNNLPALCIAPFTIQIAATGELLLWNEVSIDPIVVSQQSIVYLFSAGSEFFYAKGKLRQIEKLHHTHASCFSIPTFYELRDALEYYKTTMIRYSSCMIFNGVWFDANRIFIKRAQEAVMRRSLTQFLKNSLRGDCEIRPEQTVDESHPVDIKVTWQFANRLALIEIKWLGTPRDDADVGQAYTDYRAREGAKQLADYLDANKVQAPLHTTRGYLVIIDGRRRGLNKDITTIDKANGMFYASSEIEYSPEYHKIREDFETPIRMFAEPVCSET